MTAPYPKAGMTGTGGLYLGCLRWLAGRHQYFQIVFYPRTIWKAWRKNMLCWIKWQFQRDGCTQAAMVFWVSSERGASARAWMRPLNWWPKDWNVSKSLFLFRIKLEMEPLGEPASWRLMVKEWAEVHRGGLCSSEITNIFPCKAKSWRWRLGKKNSGWAKAGSAEARPPFHPFVCVCPSIQASNHPTSPSWASPGVQLVTGPVFG